VAAVAAAVIAAAPALGATAGAAGTATVTLKPAGNAPVHINQYGGSLSCIADGFCLAVGYKGETATWDGSWHAAPSISRSVTGVTQVSCVSPSFCVAVGTSSTNERTISYAIRWTGRGWQAPVALADVKGQAGFYTWVHSVSCTSTSFCMAVGAAIDGSAVFDGTRWRSHQGDVTGTDGNGIVSCTSSRFCLDLHDGSANYWNGSSWRWGKFNSTPLSQAIVNGFFFDVSCASTTFCVATTHQGAAMWNGLRWHVAGGTAKAVTSQVSCVSSSFCIATAGGKAPAYEWNGSAWTPTAPLGLGNTATVVSCWAEGRCLLLAGSGASLASAS